MSASCDPSRGVCSCWLFVPDYPLKLMPPVIIREISRSLGVPSGVMTPQVSKFVTMLNINFGELTELEAKNGDLGMELFKLSCKRGVTLRQIQEALCKTNSIAKHIIPKNLEAIIEFVNRRERSCLSPGGDPREHSDYSESRCSSIQSPWSPGQVPCCCPPGIRDSPIPRDSDEEENTERKFSTPGHWCDSNSDQSSDQSGRFCDCSFDPGHDQHRSDFREPLSQDGYLGDGGQQPYGVFQHQPGNPGPLVNTDRNVRAGNGSLYPGVVPASRGHTNPASFPSYFQRQESHRKSNPQSCRPTFRNASSDEESVGDGTEIKGRRKSTTRFKRRKRQIAGPRVFVTGGNSSDEMVVIKQKLRWLEDLVEDPALVHWDTQGLNVGETEWINLFRSAKCVVFGITSGYVNGAKNANYSLVKRAKRINDAVQEERFNLGAGNNRFINVLFSETGVRKKDMPTELNSRLYKWPAEQNDLKYGVKEMLIQRKRD